MSSISLRNVDGGLLEFLDQTQLPNREIWLNPKNPQEMYDIIRTLAIRGAPLIGVGAALYLAKYFEETGDRSKVLAAAQLLKQSRPTAVNLATCVDRLTKSDDLVKAAEGIFDEDVALCEGMAASGAHLIEDGDNILTHCNTGGLATAGIGTALAVITKAHQDGKKIHVYVDETRPLLQGGRLTTYELKKLAIPYTLICDNMAATLMRDGKIQKIFVGSDRIAANGDFANKVGTYSVAVLAHHHNIPFYPVAPYTTIDLNCETGKDIPIEFRPDYEVQGFRDICWSAEGSSTYNPAFDVTPATLSHGLVLDTGFYSVEDLKAGKLRELKNKF